MSVEKEIIRIALNEEGYREGSNNDSKYGSWYGMNYNPYCAMFVCWCANQAGVGTDIIPKTASCPTMKNWFNSKGRWYARGNVTPRAGDLVIFNWYFNGNADHVGIVTDVDSVYIYTVEGNTHAQGNKYSAEGVYTKKYPMSSNLILGFCRPDYGTEASEVHEDTPIFDTRGVLANGSIGAEVATLQRNLNTLNEYLNLGFAWLTYDGIFGANTKYAVTQFQTKAGLSADGIVGSATWAAMDKYLEAYKQECKEASEAAAKAEEEARLAEEATKKAEEEKQQAVNVEPPKKPNGTTNGIPQTKPDEKPYKPKYTADDALKALQGAVGKIEILDEEKSKLDTNGDGKVKADDALNALQNAVGKKEL